MNTSSVEDIFCLQNLSPQWKGIIDQERLKKYFCNLIAFLQKEKAANKVLYPSFEEVFSAFFTLPFSRIKVVILGQDPYHGDHQAHGLAFSVPKDQKKIPPSLKNIFLEMGVTKSHGNLEGLSDQGVFLLNTTLTVEANKPGSHQKKGWEIFTDTIIQKISQEKENVVFCLWGKFAQTKASLIDEKKHCILTSSHPSPLSAYRGFLGCRHFVEINKFLQKKNISCIDWSK